ncbi:MAG: hypothetical protein KGH84_00480 [Paracoccaceae bacterium]|nr:hypothetical protein [Paracoccaceae bacterium]
MGQFQATPALLPPPMPQGAILNRTHPPTMALFLTGLSSFVLMGGALSLYGPALPIYMRLFDLTQSGAGLMVSAHWVGAVAAVGAQMARVQFTPRHAIGFLGLGAALVAGQIDWPLILVGALLVGAGYGLIAALYNRRFLTEFGVRGPSMVGVLNAIFGLGAIGAPLIMVAAGNAPRVVFALIALVTLAVLPFAHPAPAEPAGTPAAPPIRLRPEMILAVLTIGCESSNLGLGPSGLVARGLSETAAAQLTSAFFAAFLLGRVSLYWIAPRVPPRLLLIGALVGVCVTSLAAAVAMPGVNYVLSGLFTGCLFPSLFVVTSAAMGSSQRATSTIIACCLMGGIVAPSALNAILSRVGEGQFFAALAALLLVPMLAVLLLPRATVRATA